MSIAEKLVTIAENEQKVYEAGQLKTLQDSEYMNAKVSGTTIAVNDVSPIEHNVGCKLSSKNLIPFPYYETSKTENGITWTVNADGSITANGTATGLSSFQIVKDSWTEGLSLNTGTYTLSGCPTGGGTSNYYIRFIGNDALNEGGDDFGSGKTLTINSSTPSNGIVLRVASRATASNLTFKPMLNEGSTATEYTPYVADIGGIEVSRMGANLIKFPYIETKSSINGITVTINADYSITLNGTATDSVYYRLNSVTYGAGKTYYLSGCPSGLEHGAIRVYDDTNNNFIDWGEGASFSTQEAKDGEIYIFVKEGITCSNLTFKPMLNEGTTATPYEPYIEPTTYQSTADGTVEGIKSISPNMTLLTNNNGVVIDANYLRDIDTYINNLKAL